MVRWRAEFELNKAGRYFGECWISVVVLRELARDGVQPWFVDIVAGYFAEVKEADPEWQVAIQLGVSWDGGQLCMGH